MRASIHLGIESTSFTPTLPSSSFQILFNISIYTAIASEPWEILSEPSATYFRWEMTFNCTHKFSIGLRSGELCWPIHGLQLVIIKECLGSFRDMNGDIILLKDILPRSHYLNCIIIKCCHEWQSRQSREDSVGTRRKGRTLGPQIECWGHASARKQHQKGQLRWTKADSPGTRGEYSRRENSSGGHGKGEECWNCKGHQRRGKMAGQWDRGQSDIYKVLTQHVDFP